jgi:hypothetical protein
MHILEANQGSDIPEDKQRKSIWDKLFSAESRTRMKQHAMALLAVLSLAFAGRAMDSHNKPVDLPPLRPDAVLVKVDSNVNGIEVGNIVYVSPPRPGHTPKRTEDYIPVKVTGLTADGINYDSEYFSDNAPFSEVYILKVPNTSGVAFTPLD